MWTNYGRIYYTEILSEEGLRVDDYSFLQSSYLCDQKKRIKLVLIIIPLLKLVLQKS